MTYRTEIRLADGRELFYYDRKPDGTAAPPTSAPTCRRR